MYVISQRPPGYKVGLLILLLGSVCYITGFSAPYWTFYAEIFEDGELRGHNGLWETCDKMSKFSHKMCATVSQLHGHSAWISTVQALQCVGLISLLAACAYAVIVNYILRDPSIHRVLEVLLVLSGLLGFTGCSIYIAKSYVHNDVLMILDDHKEEKEDDDEEYSDNMDNLEYVYKEEDDFKHHSHNDVGWALCLSITGCVLMFVTAVVIWAYNRVTITQENAVRPEGAASFTAASVGGRLVFLPPEHLAGGFCPPPYLPEGQGPAEAGSGQGTREDSCRDATVSQEVEKEPV